MPDYNPLISILIPSFNHERYIEQTIRSIWSQPYRQVEIIVIDDRSADGSLALLQRLQSESPCRMEVLVNEERSGPAATLNRAIRRANGELLAQIASDDLYAEDPFSRSVEMFRKDPGLQIVYGNGIRFDEHGLRGVVHKGEVKKLLARSAAEILEYLYTNTSPLFIQTTLIKKDLMIGVGCYDESMRADDWLINIKIFRELAQTAGGYAYRDEPVFLYRTHGANLHQDVSRHIALKMEFIDKVTPEHLKGAAKFNILYGVALMALKNGRLAEAIELFRQSRQGGSDFKRTVRFVRKFLVSATFGAVLRRIKGPVQK
jgi:glycosyltransferase involved in cell wall biosynthesis